MAIVKMKKFSLLVLESKKNELLENLQKFSKVQFINLQDNFEENEEFKNLLNKDSNAKATSDLENKQAKVGFAIGIISKYGELNKSFKDIFKEKKSLSYCELKKLAEDTTWQKLYKELKHKEEKLNSLENEITRLEADVESLISWKKLDVSIKDLKSMKTCTAYVGSIGKSFKGRFREEFDSDIPESYIEEISATGEDISLLIVFHKDKKSSAENILKKYSFSKINLNYDESPLKVISKSEARIKIIKEDRVKISTEMKEYKKYLEYLNEVYEYFQNEIVKNNVTENFLKTEKVVVINGWIPEDEQNDLNKVVESVPKDYYCIQFNEPNEKDDVPILLDNNNLSKPFESITSMYSLPKYNEIDPTPLLVPFYLLFFGMMLSDAGYGLVMFIATLMVLKFIPLEKESKNMVKLFFYLSIPTMFWGIMYGSYFTGAINIPPVWIKPEENANLILIVSMGFGLIHIYVGLGIKAYLLAREGKYADAFFDVGLWYITLTTVILYLAGSFGNIATIKENLSIIKYIMFAGMIGLVLTQGRSNKGIGAKLGSGLYGLYGITGYIGDLVSYSRLMALGLATGFIGGALNLIISFLGNGVKAWIFGPLIFIIGHVFNLFINALGAYVHTCRLQYVEYFGKFYEGGGKPFTPFKYTNKFIKIKTE
ncbi:V-type ATP synthase subunit I [Clostridium rectalis]|uniref:V-type ATP synthase subunit I n=1 Tax=Clostridium rectalis TaxID=2040295 RepID=UPI000F631D77|nr:V-type ATP synthase subunit I [Clostridium rectalis]